MKEYAMGRIVAFALLSMSTNAIFPIVLICQSANTAWVTSNDAAVTFSLGERSVISTWEWNQATTPDNRCEYQLTAMVVNDSVKYTFGFFLFKQPGAKPASGELYSLLKAGQFSLVQMTDGKARVIAGPRFATELHGQKLTINFSDSASIRRIFSSKPKTLILEARVAQLMTEKREVPIEYRR